MKVVGSSSKANRFLGRNSDLHIISESRVWIRVVEIDKRLHVLLDVGEDITHEDLRNAIPLALQWRDRLLEWQGPWMGGGANYFYYQLDHRQRTGATYSELAERINKRIADCLHEHIRYLQEYEDFIKEAEAAQPKFKLYQDYFLWALQKQNEFSNNQFALDHARDYLLLMKFDNEYCEEILQEGRTGHQLPGTREAISEEGRWLTPYLNGILIPR